MATMAEEHLLKTFELAGGLGKPRYGKITVCWAGNETEARCLARAWWSASMLGAPAFDPPLPPHVMQSLARASAADIAQVLLCSGDPRHHMAAIRGYTAVGFDHVSVHHVGPNQEGFIRFYQREVLPYFQS
jgi:coenzyme F420-dependent glucose-6-phosphate dehydrogenase